MTGCYVGCSPPTTGIPTTTTTLHVVSTPPAGGLALTGADIGFMVVIAIAAIVVGTFLVTSFRHRRSP